MRKQLFFATVSDSLSGIVSAEYYIGSDPGYGNGTSMQVNPDGTVSATIGTALTPGTYTLSLRAQDKAGNWSGVVTIVLEVI